MRETELLDQLGALAGRLDDASTPAEVELVLDTPRGTGDRGRRSWYGVVSAVAVVVLLTAIVLARPARDGEGGEAVVSGSQAQVELRGVAGPVADGAPVEVAGFGFPPGGAITVRQCAPDGCDEWRPAAQVTADREGRFTVEVAAYHDIATGRGTTPRAPVTPDWFACAPCELRAEVGTGAETEDGAHAGSTSAAAPIDLAATTQPQHPTLRIATPGPHRPGQRVRLEGSGFPPDPDGLDVTVAYCPAGARRAEECGGGPELGDLGIGPDGTFSVEAFELPAADVVLSGARCADRAGACVITWLLSTPGPLPEGLPLDLSA